jgi:flagellar biosynthesis/type III secretory pathway protein FliH
MAGKVKLKLDKAVENVRIVKGIGDLDIKKDKTQSSRAQPETVNKIQQQNQLKAELNAEKQKLLQLCSAIEQVSEDLKGFYQNSLSEGKEKIVNLAVKIAEKITKTKINAEDYNIAQIIQETVSELQTSDIMLIRLNPDDLQTLESFQKENGEIKKLKGVKFEQDDTVNKGECRVQTLKGTFERIVDVSLERIEQAMLKTV